MCNLYIQSNVKTCWLRAQQWQVNYISRCIQNPDSKLFTRNKSNVYVVKTVNNINDYGCENLKNSINEIGYFKDAISAEAVSAEVSAEAATAVVVSTDGASATTPTNPVPQVKPKIGFLINLKTNTSRMFILSDYTDIEMHVLYPHTGIQSITKEFSDTYYVDLLKTLPVSKDLTVDPVEVFGSLSSFNGVIDQVIDPDQVSQLIKSLILSSFPRF